MKKKPTLPKTAIRMLIGIQNILNYNNYLQILQNN